MGVKVVDKGFNNYKEAFSALNTAKVAVGLFANSSSQLLTKGIANEFGTSRIPERSFLRATYNKNYQRVAKRFAQIGIAISKGNYDVTNKLKLIGAEQVAEVQNTMVELKTPPNAPSTIKAKGDDNPLIDTGELRQSISSDVRHK